MSTEITAAFRSSEEPEHSGLHADWVHPATIVASYWQDGDRVDSTKLYALPEVYSDVTRETVHNLCRDICNAWNAGISIDAIQQIVEQLGSLVRKPNIKPIAAAEGVTNVGYIVVQPEIVQYVAVSNIGDIIVVKPGVESTHIPFDEFEEYVEQIRGYSVRV